MIHIAFTGSGARSNLDCFFCANLFGMATGTACGMLESALAGSVQEVCLLFFHQEAQRRHEWMKNVQIQLTQSKVSSSKSFQSMGPAPTASLIPPWLRAGCDLWS